MSTTDDDYYSGSYPGKRLHDTYDATNDDGSLRSPFCYRVVQGMRENLQEQLAEAEFLLPSARNQEQRRTLQGRIQDLKFELTLLPS